MKITEQQIECLDTLVVERLCSHKVDNLALVERFSNPRNNVLVDIIKSQKAINRDEANTIAYYVVKTKDGKLLAYFSLKCGELYEAYDVKLLELIRQTIQAIEVFQHPDKFSDATIQDAKNFVNQRYTEIKLILPSIDDYVEKKKSYETDLQKDINPKMQRVLKTHPAVELVEFCANENEREAWNGIGLEKKLGGCVFWHHIVPLIYKLQEIVGCQYIYLFAADKSIDGNLVNYYKQMLRFYQPSDWAANKPQYDFNCMFLCQAINDLKEGQDAFYENFNPDGPLEDIV